MQWTSVASVFVPGDFIVFPIVGIGLLQRDRRDERQTRLRRQLLAPGLIILIGSMLALLNVGLTPWAVKTIVLDLVVVALFLGVLALARTANFRPEWIDRSVAAAGAFVALFVLVQVGYRPAATFGQVNMTGHFLASCAVWLTTRAPVRLRIVLIPLIVAATMRTSSFGALLSMGLVFAYVGYGALRRVLANTPALVVMVMWGVVVAGAGYAVREYTLNALSSADSSKSGLTSNRLERSGNGRSEIWLDGLRALQEDPLGIGPGGFKPLEIHVKLVQGEADSAEIHHDTLGYLVERGPIGLIGLLYLWLVLWFAGRPRGPTRGLLVMTFVAGFFRETMHFRHLWVLLGLAVALEMGTDRQLAERGAAARFAGRLDTTRRSRVDRELAKEAVRVRRAERARNRHVGFERNHHDR